MKREVKTSPSAFRGAYSLRRRLRGVVEEPWDRLFRNAFRRTRRQFRGSAQYNILGFSSTGHGGSIALVSSQYGVRALNLERFLGVKNAVWLAREEARELRESNDAIATGIRVCLRDRGLQLPTIAIFEDTWEPMLRALLHGLPLGAADIDFVIGSESHFAINRGWQGRALSQYFPRAVVHTGLEHHALHRFQAFFGSGFEDAAVLTADASGEPLARLGGKRVALSLSEAQGTRFQVFAEYTSPESSPGRVYNIFNTFLGFDAGEEGKTMGLSSYGRDGCYRHLRPLLTLHEDGSFTFPEEAELQSAIREYGVQPRIPGKPPSVRHQDVALAAQLLLDDMLRNAVKALERRSTSQHLCVAGGTALNSVTNERVFRSSRFEEIYVMPNAGDLGQALAGALWAERALANGSARSLRDTDGLGPLYREADIEQALSERGLPKAAIAVHRLEQPAEAAARLVAQGHIVGWFQGGSEFGPRSLGYRSILADPRDPGMKDRLNERVKHRESFRPFAPAVLAERAGEFFELEGESPFMLRVVDVHPSMREVIPSVTHVDGTARVQTVSHTGHPGFYALIAAFDRITGVPVVLNTSFNVAGKPIVETPGDALDCFLSTEIDALFLHDFLVSKGLQVS